MAASDAVLSPRKTPVQVRSNVTVNAILQATVQVLVKEGSARITTKKVAARAGVSIGTLYQYFPNKNSLLFLLLKQQFDSFEASFCEACIGVRGARLTEMAKPGGFAFGERYVGKPPHIIRFEGVAGNCDGCRLMRTRTLKVLTDTLSTASDRTVTDPSQAAKVLFSAMAGVTRDIVAGGLSRNTMSEMERELDRLLRAYLLGSSQITVVSKSLTRAL